MILAIDPGNIQSAYVVLDKNLKPMRFDKIENDLLNQVIHEELYNNKIEHFAVEMVAHYGLGMPAGKEVFDTCVWIGRFWENADRFLKTKKQLIYRKEEKINLCGSMKAKDANIRQALIDRFGVVGTKRSPGWFYGVSKDVWSAVAVGVTYADLYLK
jgi:hypothetical protein